MGKYPKQQSALDHRRRLVAGLRLRHLTLQEITDAIAKQGLVNPRTDKPYDLSQIHRDVKYLEKQWKQEAAKDIAEHKGNHLAELVETRRRAWQDNKLYYVLKSLEQEAKVLGLEDSDVAAAVGQLADTFLAGVNTVQSMQVEDLSE